MIVDRLENLGMYNILEEPYAEAVAGFCAKAGRGSLREGRYELIGQELFALVQNYETRKACGFRMEAHKKYVDMQYLISGEEYFYIHDTARCTACEEYSEQKDCMFLKCTAPDARVRVTAGCFALLLPQDAHMPCIAAGEAGPVEKIVFKISLDCLKK